MCPVGLSLNVSMRQTTRDDLHRLRTTAANNVQGYKLRIIVIMLTCKRTILSSRADIQLLSFGTIYLQTYLRFLCYFFLLLGLLLE